MTQHGEAALLYEIFSGKRIIDFFSNATKTTVDVIEIQEKLEKILQMSGKLLSVEPSGDLWRVNFRTRVLLVRIVVNALMKISDLRVISMMDVCESIDSICDEIRDFGDCVSFSITRNGLEVQNHRVDSQMQIASLFKLFIAREYLDLKKNYSDFDNRIIKIDSAMVSLQTGILQDFPDKTYINYNMIFNLMLCLSDNTAADMLLDIVGRSSIEKYLSESSIPAMKTRECYVMNTYYEKYADLWFASDYHTRLKVLASTPYDTPSILHFYREMIGTPIGWYSTAKKINNVMSDLIECSILGFGKPPIIFDVNRFTFFRYKGGSSPGVYAVSISLKCHSSDLYTMTFILNNFLSHMDFDTMQRKLIALIRKMSYSLEMA
ncbi:MULTISPECIES: serine hydrolase [Deinococcus]|uniref:Serine hydrolase n=1 Tax=Deinococcus rufus TaxID=2136097 RepID=A0ABV7Z789_9DEIO|nr:serine hydrolase [Deinococcus sp. AB2017081]WQE97177.1 serine hydrolase [Deinococcus sp. AB2017081]